MAPSLHSQYNYAEICRLINLAAIINVQTAQRENQRRGWTARFVLLSVLQLALTSTGLAVPTSALSDALDKSEAIANLELQIADWSQEQFAQQGLYNFATQDRRLQVPGCKTFTFSTSTSLKEPQSAFMLKVSCAETGWSRLIRAKANERVAAKVALINVLTPIAVIEAGRKVTAKDFTASQLPPHRTPKGALSKLDGSVKWFSARAMRPGYILTEKDLVQPRRVLVVNKALPAGTLLTQQAFDVTERATNIPRDAITSMENIANLAASKLLHPGDILRRRDLTKGKLIRRGEKVALLSQGRSYAISSEVVALEDGFLGEQVRLLNTESQRRVSAIVTGASQAKTLSTK
jgi:flagella basal body P-ring formation protein FlgA